MGEVDQGFQFRLFPFHAAHNGMEGLGAFLENEFIDQQLGTEGALQAVIGAPFLLARFHALAVLVPEIRGQFPDPGIEQVRVFQHLVVEVVLRRQAQGTGLDAHVDVFRHQDHGTLGIAALEVDDHGQDLVVVLGLGQGRGQFRINGLRLQEQAATGQLVGRPLQGNALLDVVVFQVGQDLVQGPAALPGVTGDFRHAFFVVVQLLQGHDGEKDIVFLKAEQAGGIVHEHVGIQHKKLAGFGGGFLFTTRAGFTDHSGRFPGGWLKLQGFDEIQHFLGMTGHFHAPPFPLQHAPSVNDEGAAFNASYLFPIHFFQLDDPELLAEAFFLVGNQGEGEVLLGFEIFVGFHAVPGNPGHHRPQGLEFRIQVPELLGFRGAARGAVLGVKIEHHRMTPVGGKGEVAIARGGQGKVGEGFGHLGLLLVLWCGGGVGAKARRG